MTQSNRTSPPNDGSYHDDVTRYIIQSGYFQQHAYDPSFSNQRSAQVPAGHHQSFPSLFPRNDYHFQQPNQNHPTSIPRVPFPANNSVSYESFSALSVPKSEAGSEISASTTKSSNGSSNVSIRYQQVEKRRNKPRLSSAALERRKERNKLLARKTRQKKKEESEELRDQLMALAYENQKLKSVIQSRIPYRVLLSSKSNNIHWQLSSLLPENMCALINSMVRQECIQDDNTLTIKQRTFVIVNPNLPDSPIVYVSDGFVRLTGYSPKECLGQNCRFLQGEETDRMEVYLMKQSLQRQEDFSVVLQNYTKEGNSFWNRLEVAHLRDGQGKVHYLLGILHEMEGTSVRVRLARQRYEHHQDQLIALSKEADEEEENGRYNNKDGNGDEEEVEIVQWQHHQQQLQQQLAALGDAHGGTATITNHYQGMTRTSPSLSFSSTSACHMDAMLSFFSSSSSSSPVPVYPFTSSFLPSHSAAVAPSTSPDEDGATTIATNSASASTSGRYSAPSTTGTPNNSTTSEVDDNYNNHTHTVMMSRKQ